MLSTMATQSRSASLIASLRVREPVVTGIDLGAEQPHAGDVERLALGVDLAHVDDALEAHQRAGGGGGDAVLARAGLGDDPGLAHALGQQRLAEHVVDLVRAGVVEVLALEQDPRPARVLGEPSGVGQRRRAAGVVALQAVELGEELGVGAGLVVGRRRARPARRSAPRARTARRSGRSGRASSGSWPVVGEAVDSAVGRSLRWRCRSIRTMSGSSDGWKPGGHQRDQRTAARGSSAGHQALADEHRVGAPAGVGEQVARAAHARLGDPQHVVGQTRGDPAEDVRSTSRV